MQKRKKRESERIRRDRQKKTRRPLLPLDLTMAGSEVTSQPNRLPRIIVMNTIIVRPREPHDSKKTEILEMTRTTLHATRHVNLKTEITTNLSEEVLPLPLATMIEKVVLLRVVHRRSHEVVHLEKTQGEQLHRMTILD